MSTLSEKYAGFKTALTQLYGPGEAGSITQLVFEEMLELNAFTLRTRMQEKITSGQEKKLGEQLYRLLSGEPLQHVLGSAWFYGERFTVNPHVLIPRRETEELVEWVIKESISLESPSILDIGTGSGCIAISLKKLIPAARVTALDLSAEALGTAKENASRILGPGNGINLLHRNILDSSLLEATGPFDIIVSNPPYITEKEKASMHKNVLEFEPASALFVPDADPLLFYKAIALFSLLNLKENGKLFFEINEHYGEETLVMLRETGFTSVELKKDMQQKDRMIRASR